MVGLRPHVPEALAARMRVAFEHHNVDFDQHVRMQVSVAEPQFLQLAASMDINLDTIGWSGGVSTFDLLAQDLPTLSVETPTLRGRQSAAMLRRIDCQELIATDADAYVQLAIDLGRDRDRRSALRERIAQLKHRLYDDSAPVAAFAEFLARNAPGG